MQWLNNGKLFRRQGSSAVCTLASPSFLYYSPPKTSKSRARTTVREPCVEQRKLDRKSGTAYYMSLLLLKLKHKVKVVSMRTQNYDHVGGSTSMNWWMEIQLFTITVLNYSIVEITREAVLPWVDRWKQNYSILQSWTVQHGKSHIISHTHCHQQAKISDPVVNEYNQADIIGQDWSRWIPISTRYHTYYDTLPYYTY